MKDNFSVNTKELKEGDMYKSNIMAIHQTQTQALNISKIKYTKLKDGSIIMHDLKSVGVFEDSLNITKLKDVSIYNDNLKEGE